jgi:hypothetical protein
MMLDQASFIANASKEHSFNFYYLVQSFEILFQNNWNILIESRIFWTIWETEIFHHFSSISFNSFLHWFIDWLTDWNSQISFISYIQWIMKWNNSTNVSLMIFQIHFQGQNCRNQFDDPHSVILMRQSLSFTWKESEMISNHIKRHSASIFDWRWWTDQSEWFCSKSRYWGEFLEMQSYLIVFCLVIHLIQHISCFTVQPRNCAIVPLCHRLIGILSFSRFFNWCRSNRVTKNSWTRCYSIPDQPASLD